MTDHVLVERPEAHPGVQVIRFNRPEKKNAITRDMYAKMTNALTVASSDPAVRATAFLGTDGCFSAGNDMADFLAFAMGGAMGMEVIAFLKALATATKPVVSGVDGLAIGIGTTIHLHCDLTISSDRSLFKTPFVDLALVPEAASSLIAPRIMGHQRAFALLAAGEPLTAREALDAGLIWKIVAQDAVQEETLALAGRLAKKPPEALRIARDLVRGDRGDVLARIDEEAKHFAAQLKSAEARAAFEAFMRR
ncbi:crotonase/enoyl-CoA hydratase family protein [Ensifer adhaerens]|uniref:crotonase/enoyl-CoA hydratase family protein n=1 Tax=Ensifer adhaerens TaxID=106592 RepID=UPI001CC17F75|nr:crotonase/enoyl-CoA hydratase family protein [Ensifer adhaerens]MBZ7920703.1 crotonase/enoyl-CoA hydratase family protein [Ensifer adhaerens]UAX93169.1 crotonase/enoyl-CoA hydratase family protein [Ensifer adhaerens]UAY00806.1 crotonase/enoyl-CoA hydratase family protein [Ensifer adhaerens]UAY08187.1 crotonase/enoyl-CoA hydratase family protein [Ensifer adhaerens]